LGTVGRLTAAQRRIYRIIKLLVPNGSPQVYAANAAKCAALGRPFDVSTAIETAIIAACAPGKPMTGFSRIAVRLRQPCPRRTESEFYPAL